MIPSSAMALRRRLILNALKENGATSPENARTLEEANVIHPGDFKDFTRQLVDLGVIRRTQEGKYWVEG